jgi:hypothetical protein
MIDPIAERSTDQIVEIPVSKAKLAWLLLSGILMTVASALVFLRHPSTDYALWLHIVTGACAFLFFAFASVRIIQKLVAVEPGLRISPRGISGDVIRPRDDTLPWSAIVSVDESARHRQRFVTLKLDDPDAYIARGFDGLAASVMKASVRITGSPINISARTLKISHAGLLQLMRNYFDRYGSAR